MKSLLMLLCLLFAFAGPADAQRRPRGAPPSEAPAPAPEEAPAAAPAEAPAAPVRGRRGAPAPAAKPAAEAHARVFAEDPYPSAARCASCHEQIYDEWRVSNHAYAGISPMFHKFEQKISELAPTIGTFCVRCHMGVGSALNEPREAPLWRRSAVSREGVTCISCHRVADEYGKTNGERRIVPGTIYQPVYGPLGGDGVAEVLKNRGRYRVAASPEEGARAMPIHTAGVKFEQISQSEFCVSCHQVAVNLGIKLEVVWDQYRASPAHKNGVACQDCHMGKVPGKAAGYAAGPVAEGMSGGRGLNPTRKRTNHSFFGPGYPIAHPGVFPHNKDAPEDWTIERWLKFDYRARWGSDEFERDVRSGKVKASFPAEWSDAGDRAQAWSIVASNLEKINEKREQRKQLMENGSRIDGPFFHSDLKARAPLRFSYRVTNTNPGHNMPSGSLGAQPEIWLNVALIGPDGRRVWESGYVDSIGDMADLHSLDVRAGRLAHDEQLFNLQTKFLTTNVKGTDREMYLPVNFDIDQLPFLRPPGQPVSVLNHPPFVRMEQRSLPPLGSRVARYSVPAAALSQPGNYKLAVRLRSRAEPIYFMRFVGATLDMEQAMNEWMLDIHPYTVEFAVKP
jgi:nitrate/TMAO reductase-like tetraheme cytochrome c subunit